MPTNITPAQGGWSQAKNRLAKFFWDQHRDQKAGFPEGRCWWAWCEKQVDGSDAAPIAELAPVAVDMTLPDGTFVKGWSAPWYPEPKYMEMAIRGMTGSRFRIDYARMRKDYEDANIAYYSRANAAAFHARWEPLELYAPVPFQLQAAKVEGETLGAPPKSPKIPEAALAGDRWLLGFDKQENEMLRSILDADNRMVSRTAYYTNRQWAAEPKPSEFSADELAEAARVLKQAKTMRDAKAAKRTQTEEAA